MALSAFDSFCRGRAGRYPRLADREDLWRLLVVITVRKAFDQVERAGRGEAGRRAAGRRGGYLADGGMEAGAGLDRFVGPRAEPRAGGPGRRGVPRLMSRGSEDDSLRLVLDLSLEGYRRAEIAQRMGTHGQDGRRGSST